LGYQNNYFLNDKYQGIPCGGFTKLIKNMLVHKNIELIHHKPQIQFINKTVFIDQQPISGHIFYCGQIDELFNFKYGVIPYRSLNIKFMTKKNNSFQSAAIINYPAHKTMTRISEYKKINRQTTPNVTTISREYPGQYNRKSKVFGTPYYPINNSQSLMIYKKYLSHLKQYRNFHLLGRLAEYKYFDMDDAIENAMRKFNSFIGEKMHKN
jgi:UDP-galactopyranose mutase